MKLETGAGAVLTGVLCLVLAGCITLSDPRVAGEEDPGTRTLTLEADGPGSIVAEGLGYTCTSVCTVPVEAGSAVSLRAMPSGDQSFAGWEGPCSGAESCSVNVDGDMKVRAVFANYFLNVNVEGGGTVNIWPPGVDCSSKCIVKFDSPEKEVQVRKKTEKTEIKDWGGICEGAVNSVCVINIDGKTEVSVETETEVTEVPPAEDPPAGDPPAEDPPAEDQPAEDPPAEDPPPEDPPAEDPPAEDPPAEDPPAEDPPAEDPPAEEPMAEEPSPEGSAY